MNLMKSSKTRMNLTLVLLGLLAVCANASCHRRSFSNRRRLGRCREVWAKFRRRVSAPFRFIGRGAKTCYNRLKSKMSRKKKIKKKEDVEKKEKKVTKREPTRSVNSTRDQILRDERQPLNEEMTFRTSRTSSYTGSTSSNGTKRGKRRKKKRTSSTAEVHYIVASPPQTKHQKPEPTGTGGRRVRKNTEAEIAKRAEVLAKDTISTWAEGKMFPELLTSLSDVTYDQETEKKLCDTWAETPKTKAKIAKFLTHKLSKYYHPDKASKLGDRRKHSYSAIFQAFAKASEKYCDMSKAVRMLNLFHFKGGPVDHLKHVLTIMSTSTINRTVRKRLMKRWKALDSNNSDAVKKFFDGEISALQEAFANKYFDSGKYGKHATTLYEVIEKAKREMVANAVQAEC